MPPTSGTVFIGSSEAGDKEVEEELIQEQEDKEGIDSLVKRANLVVFEASRVFPILARQKDKIIICPNRVTISYNKFLSKYEYPMPIENVTGARVHRDFMFGTLYIETFGIEKPAPMRHLRINEARLARRYILALIECKKANVELPMENIEELREKLKSIGTVRSGEDFTGKYHDI